MTLTTTARNGYERYEHLRTTPEPRPHLPRNQGTCRICGGDLNRVRLCPEHM